ncbi:MAG: Asp-tRNA(Asn)/Glu-tRNA(Gln) amidotransferase subunit GatB [Minisyncoccales bacterium]
MNKENNNNQANGFTQYNFTSDIVIGLEIHIELNTKSKMFCSCKRSGDKDEKPNTRTCPVCLGHPGSKPVLNKEALNKGIKIGLALDCEIAPELIFSRKSYFYPDLAKNYQISQFELPLGSNGKVELEDNEIGITRIHLEEDPASLVHPNGMTSSGYVLIDYNRSGDPLCEIVTEPDLKSPAQAREFMKKLITILNYIGVFDINSCIIKADANISIKESNYTRAEIKNITGFKEIERALNYELARQKKEVIEDNKTLVQETRGWDAQKGITYTMRVKETSEDYGYIIDPDLVAIDITEKKIDEIKQSMPELPKQKLEKFINVHKIKLEDAKIISQELKLAELFENIAKEIDPLLAAKWLRRELLRVMNYNSISFDELKIDEKHLIELLTLVEKNKITDKTAKTILEKLIEEPFDIKKYVKENDLETVQDTNEIEKFVKESMDENPQAVDDIKSGNTKSINFIVGQVMRKSKGKANPKEVNEIIKKLI